MKTKEHVEQIKAYLVLDLAEKYEFFSFISIMNSD